MPHFRVDDGFDGHPKTVRAGDDALGMWVRAGAWCMRYLTDGFVPEWWVKQQPKGAAKAKKLIDAGFWHPGAERDGERGYQFHEFVGPGRQDSREKIEADRELARKRKQKSRSASQEESRRDNHRDDHRDDHRESRQESRRSPGYIPNPTQPNPTDNSGHLPESATESNARDSIAATPGAELVRQLVPNEHPDAVRTILRVKATELIRGGTPRETVAHAIELWLTKPALGPNALPSLVSEVLKSRHPTHNGAGKATEKAIGYRQLGQELIDELHGDQP